MPPYQYRSSSRKTVSVYRRSGGVLAFVLDPGSGRNRTRAMAISTPQTTKRAGKDIFIKAAPSRQSDNERKTFPCFRKRIPLTIPKLRRSSACVSASCSGLWLDFFYLAGLADRPVHHRGEWQDDLPGGEQQDGGLWPRVLQQDAGQCLPRGREAERNQARHAVHAALWRVWRDGEPVADAGDGVEWPDEKEGSGKQSEYERGGQGSERQPEHHEQPQDAGDDLCEAETAANGFYRDSSQDSADACNAEDETDGSIGCVLLLRNHNDNQCLARAKEDIACCDEGHRAQQWLVPQPAQPLADCFTQAAFRCGRRIAQSLKWDANEGE